MLLLLAALLLPQPPPAPAAEPALAWVEGRVLDSQTKMPLRDALIVLQRVDQSYSIGEDLWRTQPTPGDAEPAAARRAVMTGDDGRFRFRVNVPAKFTLYGEKLGYVRLSDGPRSEVKEAGGTLVFDLHLIQESRLEGRVIDRESGEPVRGMRVIAHGQWEQAAKGFLIPRGSAVTGEKGEFVIEKLKPDEYFVETRPGFEARVLPAGPEKDFRQAARFGYGPTWFPNAPTREESAPVRLLSASTADRIELQVQKRRFAALRGRLLFDESAAGGGKEVMVMLMRLNHGWDSRSYAVEARGAVKPGSGFEIGQLAAGRYWLGASIPGASPADHQAADLIVDVTDENLDGLDLYLQRGFELTGHVRLGPMEGPLPETDAPPLPDKVTVGLDPVQRSHTAADRPAEVRSETGEFALPGAFPGEYRFWVRAPSGYFHTETRYNGAPALHNTVTLERSAGRQVIEAVLRPSGGSLSVTVTDGTNQVPNALVLVMPEPVHESAGRSLRLRATSDAKGVALLPGMPAGAYRVIALVGGRDWSMDARLLDRFRAAPQVKISGGGQHTLQIRPESQ